MAKRLAAGAAKLRPMGRRGLGAIRGRGLVVWLGAIVMFLIAAGFIALIVGRNGTPEGVPADPSRFHPTNPP